MRVAIALLICGAAALAHEGEPPAPHDLWTAWKFDPLIVVGLVLTAVLYAVGARRERGAGAAQQRAWWCGWLALVVALVSPVHGVGESLFSVHMVQHEILMLAAAPLLVLGRPLVPFLWALPMGWRRSLGALGPARAVQASWKTLTDPFVSWTVHFAALWAWHIPVLFDATLKNAAVHAAQHLSFLQSALLFWWALIHGRGHRLAYGGAVLYMFTTAMHNSVLGALLTFSPRAWYPAYAATTAAWGLTPLEDQQLGGLVMWVPAGLVYIAGALWFLLLWMRESEARVTKREQSYGD
jgi:putative membrane protein